MRTDTDALVRVTAFVLLDHIRNDEELEAYVQARVADTIERLTRERDEAQQVCAEAYQVVGVLLDDTGQFETEHGTKILDNLSEHRPVHDDVLPWSPADTIERLTRERDKAVERESALHDAICQAVSIMNMSFDVAKSADSRKAKDILRQALVDYADAATTAVISVQNGAGLDGEPSAK